MKKIISAVLALLLTVSCLLFLGSCQLTDWLFEHSEPEVTTRSPEGSEAVPGTSADHPSTGDEPGVSTSEGTTFDISIVTPETGGSGGLAYPDYMTGLSADRDYSKNRPVAIVIDNLSAAVPQSGLSRADILIECMVEGKITRLVMITNKYYANEVWGPVRSTRDYLVSLSRSFGNVLMIGAGFSPTGEKLIKDNSYDYLDGVHDKYALTGFFRDPARYNESGYEHSLMITGQGIKALAGVNDIAVTGSYGKAPFSYSNDRGLMSGAGSGTADYAIVNYSDFQKVQFVYSRSNQSYYRYQFGSRAHVDAENGEQLNFENVLILFAKHDDIPGDEAGRITVETTGSGSGYYVTRGRYIPITWQRAGIDSPFTFATASGGGLTFTPGKTMICVCPDTFATDSSRVSFK